MLSRDIDVEAEKTPRMEANEFFTDILDAARAW
jgi:hypothetical protein